MTVENLEIKVKTDADQAAAKLTSLSNALGRVQSSAKGVSGNTNGAAKGIKNVGEAAKKANKPLGNFIGSLKRIAFYRIIRGIIKSITQAMKEGLEWSYNFAKNLPDAVDSSGRFAAALDRMKTASSTLKAQLGSALIAVLTALEPIFKRLIDLALRAADAISQFFAAFTGTTYVKATGGLVKAMQSGAKAAKEWKNQLLGFDEINRLNEPSQGGGGGGSALDGINGADTPLSDWAQKIHDNLAAVELAMAGFELALGAILLFSGAHPMLGLGLMILGASTLASAVSENWESIPPKVQYAITAIMTILGGALFALGAIFMLTGHFGLGLGFMIAGVTMVGAVACSFDRLTPEVQKAITSLMLVVSVALVALGFVFLLTGHFGLGLAMLLAGGALGFTAMNLNWDALPDKLKETWQGIKNWWDTHVAKFFTREYWQETFDKMFDVDAHIKMPVIEWWSQPVWSWLAPVMDFFGLPNTIPVPHVSWQQFAMGGFPSEGSLFIANEAGPELVGTMGGRSAVANNDQIVEGIRQGVYDAVVAANANGNSDVSVKVYLDSREIKAGQERLARAWG